MNQLPCIMVVEDDPILKNLLGHTLAGKYQTVYAANGDEALALFEQFKPVLILLDLTLPGGKDGFALLEELRARTDEGKTVPIVVVSNLGEQQAKDRVMALGANGYLVKAEVDVDEIVEKVGEYLAS
jgi:two-component system, OmpR family, alkaline phosphatase synthesis response regulator PhoP